MPHKAVDERTVLYGDATDYWSHTSGSTTHKLYTLKDAQLRQLTYLKMPATVINERRADGTRPPSAYSIERHLIVIKPHGIQQEASYPPYWGWYIDAGRTSTYITELGPWPEVNADLLLDGSVTRFNVDNIARTNFLKKLSERAGKGQVELGVAAGEFRETCDMFTDLAGKTRRQIHKIANLKSLTATSVTRFLHTASRVGVEEALVRVGKRNTHTFETIIDAWLTYQMGIKPLMKDAFDGVVWLKAAQEQNKLRLVVNVKSGYEEVNEVELQMGYRNVNWCEFDTFVKFQRITGSHYACAYEVPTVASIPEQLGLYNPASVAWNLLRFTWLTDAIIDIGGWLDAMCAARNCRFVEGTNSTIQRCRAMSIRYEDPFEGRKTYTRLPLPVIDVDKFNRTVLGHGVMPPTLPGVRVNLGLTAMANAIAALTKVVR